MEKNMKKIIVALFSFILFLSAQNVLAASVWNQASNDCPTGSVANFTTNTGIIVPCWPLSTVSANPGDVVNLRVYYHNTSSANATNVRVILNAPSGAASSHIFSGQIVSDQGSISFSSLRFNTPAGSTLSWSGTHWLPNQEQTETKLLSGQNGKEILSGGLNIGTIAPGWDTQGSIVIVFSVVGTGTPIPSTPTGTLTANNNSCTISAGKNSCEVNFSWNTSNPNGTSSVTRDGGPTVATGNSGTKAFTVPYNTATFRLYNSAIELDTATVTSSCTAGTSWNGTICTENLNPTYSCSILNFTVGGALSTTVTLSNSVELAWTTTGCNSVNISNVGNNLPANGNQIVYPAESTTYRLTGNGSIGTNPSRSVSVTVNPNPNPTYSCSITNFTANGSLTTTITDGRSLDISWNTNNCTTINIQGVGTNLSSSGNRTVYPSQTTRYTITASGLVGSTQTRYVDVTVKPNNDSNYDCSINDFSASDTYIYQGDSVILRWDTSDCDDVNISNIGNVSSNGSRTVYPYETTTYVLRASADNSESRSIQVSVNDNQITSYVPAPAFNTNVVTTVATNVTQTTAQLNGLITNSNYVNNSTVYFEYGTTINLGTMTTVRATNGNTNFSEFLTNLNPKTIYFFQAVGEGSNGISRGAIEVFQTLPYINTTNTNSNTQVVKKVVVQGTTVVKSESPIMLKIENRYQTIGKGDIVDYVVTYKNIGTSKLTHPMIQVIIPKGITVINTSAGTYSEDDRTLSVPIEDLNHNTEGTIYLQARVDSVDSSKAQIVTTVILIYTNPNGAQENAMAYVLNNPKISNVLGASAFFGSVLKIGLIGWLLIIIFILLLVLIARSIYSHRNGVKTTI
jgi:uncharacterized repeat protein (TIGR01451 family)